MSKITLNNVASFQNDSTAVATVNANSSTIQTAFDNTLSRDGTSPNQMGANLDMNSNRILNLPTPSSSTDPLRVQDLSSYIVSTGNSIIVPGTTVVGNLVLWNSTTGAALSDSGVAFPFKSLNINNNVASTTLTVNNQTAGTGFNTLSVNQDWSPAAGTNIIASFTSYGTDPSRFVIRQAGGTQALPSQTVNGQQIGQLSFRGYQSGGAFATVSNASVACTAAENFTSSAQGTFLTFFTTPTGTTIPAGVLFVQSSGGVSIGTATDPGLGKLLVASGITVSAGGASITGSSSVSTGNFTISNSGSTQFNIDNPGGQYSVFNFTNSSAQKAQVFWDNIAKNFVFNPVVAASTIDFYPANAIQVRFQANGGVSFGSSVITTDAGAGRILLAPNTVANLPAASSSLKGAIAIVSDGTAALAWGATVTGGASTPYMVFCNGTNWTVAGK